MNIAAAIAYTLAVLLGLGGLTAQAVWSWRERRPPHRIAEWTSLPLQASQDCCIYHRTVADLGNPAHLNWHQPFIWPA